MKATHRAPLTRGAGSRPVAPTLHRVAGWPACSEARALQWVPPRTTLLLRIASWLSGQGGTTYVQLIRRTGKSAAGWSSIPTVCRGVCIRSGHRRAGLRAGVAGHLGARYTLPAARLPHYPVFVLAFCVFYKRHCSERVLPALAAGHRRRTRASQALHASRAGSLVERRAAGCRAGSLTAGRLTPWLHVTC